jgi:hypothetical protein
VFVLISAAVFQIDGDGALLTLLEWGVTGCGSAPPVVAERRQYPGGAESAGDIGDCLGDREQLFVVPAPPDDLETGAMSPGAVKNADRLGLGQ